MSIDQLNAAQIEAGLKTLQNWEYDATVSCLTKEWQFKNFKTAIAMLNRVSDLAESQNHHPEMLSAYKRICVKLWTHDVQGLTHKDFDLAQAIDSMVAQEFSV
jgi:4a-hydroxytetrahydrobiopterin dehydratase